MSDDRYRLVFEPRREYLFVECHGTLNVETDRLIDEAIIRECTNLDLRRVLIDIRQMQGRLTMLENFQAGASFGQRLGRYVSRIAIVDLSEFDHVKRNRFFELVALNRSVYVKFFDSIGEAEVCLSVSDRTINSEKPAPC